jgi:hypothetical protein
MDRAPACALLRLCVDPATRRTTLPHSCITLMAADDIEATAFRNTLQ